MRARIGRVLGATALSAFLASASASQTITYTYDAHGQVTSSTYSTGLATTYTYDAAQNRTDFAQNATGLMASPESANTEMNNAVTLNALSNDTSSHSYTLSISAHTAGLHGTTSVSGGNITYTPTTGYTGTDVFNYTISDGHGSTATTTDTINVLPGPTANSDSFSTTTMDYTADVVANDTDPMGYALTVTSATHGSSFTTSIVGNKVVVSPNAGVVPSRTFNFNYTISDGHGGTATGSASVTWLCDGTCP